jgi:hypothetical protein
MARFLVGQLDDAGSFRPYVADGTPATEAYDVLYYPGEAMLSLLRLYAIDHDSRWIDAVRRAARWRLRTPYKGKRDSYRDFWFSLVLANLESIAHDDAIADRMRAIANGAMGEQDEEERDFALGDEAYALTPRANPTSTMLEAIATTIPRLRANGRSSEEIDRALDHGRRAASFVLWSQIDEESSWLARDPAQALGGVRGDSWRGYVRIDDDQHALMAMLALANAIDSTR